MTLLPLATLILVWLTLRRLGWDWRRSWLAAMVVHGVLVVAPAEALSLVHGINATTITLWWMLCAGAGGWTLSRVSREKTPPAGGRRAISPTSAGLLGGVIALGAVTLAVAVIAPPNTWDSMTYHMSRVMHWMQSGSLAHYPTNVIRQLYMAPWAELAILHLQLLGGDDRFANLVQWSCMATSVVGVSLLVRELGGDEPSQTLGAVVAATIPMGVLQASSTQTDYVVATWSVCFAVFGLEMARRPTRPATLLAAASLGLALLSKGTAYLYAAPLLAWFAASLVRGHGRKAIAPLLLVAAVVVVLNAGHGTRNWRLFGSPLGPPNPPHTNETFGPATLVSNVVRNFALHLSSPVPGLDAAVVRGVRGLDAALGIDPDDPGTTIAGTRFRLNRFFHFHEDESGNVLHLVLIAATIPIVLCRPRLRRTRDVVPYLASMTAAGLLFCGYLKWTPWHSRLHLPLFLLWSPLVALAVASVRARAVPVGVAIVLLLGAVPYAIGNASRPLVGRRSILHTERAAQYFANLPPIQRSYQQAAETIGRRQCRNVGLVMEEDGWEYPLWVLLDAGGHGLRIEHLEVANASAGLPWPAFTPCAVVRGDASYEISELTFPEAGPQGRVP
jgi:hypothetical protein